MTGMDEILPIFLPVYFSIYFLSAFVWRSVIVSRHIGKSPVVFPKDDSAYSLVGFYFKITTLCVFAYIVAYSFFPEMSENIYPIRNLSSLYIRIAGISLLISSLIWILIAQYDMQNSWRIGIDLNQKTELIQSGLFSVSRNPIFLGMILNLLGLFFLTPNLFTLIFLILGFVLIQIQIRLEEDYLLKAHPQAYSNYKKKVRRFL